MFLNNYIVITSFMINWYLFMYVFIINCIFFEKTLIEIVIIMMSHFFDIILSFFLPQTWQCLKYKLLYISKLSLILRTFYLSSFYN